MPVEIAEDVEKWRSMISFRTSVIFEMLLSLHATAHPRPEHEDWAESTKGHLSPELLKEVELFHSERFGRGPSLMELAIDYPDHHDVEGFLAYLRKMAVEEFLFYILGRVVPPGEIKDLPWTEEELEDAISAHVPEGWEKKWITPGHLEVLNDPEGYRARIADLWQGYWEQFFREDWPNYREAWERSIKENEARLSREEPLDFVRSLSGKKDLPPFEIPPGTGLEEIILVPSCFAPGTRGGILFGYGSITVLYDCRMTEERREELRRTAGEIVSVAKALDDITRLEILRLIARDESIYGQKIASTCSISQPSVSRHVRILRDAGLIEERRMDNRIGYNICWEVVEGFSKRLSDYLRT